MLTLLLACDSGDEAAKDTKKEEAKNTAPEAKAEADAKAATPARVEPAEAPEGTAEIGGVFVRTCAEPHPCPSMKHAEGKAYCEGLKTGDMTWRLPSLAELESWRGNAALTAFDVMHWTGTAWEEDAGQVWIYDPGSGAKTTAPPDRKPFTIRCVAEAG